MITGSLGTSYWVLGIRISSTRHPAPKLPYTPFQTDGKQLLRFHCKFHGQLLQHLFGITVYDKAYGTFGIHPPLLAVKQLVLADLRSGCFMLNDTRFILHLYIRPGMRPAA